MMLNITLFQEVNLIFNGTNSSAYTNITELDITITATDLYLAKCS